MLLVAPGAVTPLREINDILEDRHKHDLEAYQADQAHRAKVGAPACDDLDWAEEEVRLRAMLEAVAEQDIHRVAAGHMAGALACSQAVADPGEWARIADLEGIKIRVRLPAAADTRKLREAWVASSVAGDVEAMFKAQEDIINDGLVEVAGICRIDEHWQVETPEELKAPYSQEQVAMLRDAGVLPVLVGAVLHMWRLDRGKAWRSGVRPQAT
jgi:hypothetical protein